jgi:hypothetical protein
MRRSRSCLEWFYALRALVFCHGDAAALFYSIIVRFKNALFQVESGTPGITAAFFSNYKLMCLILAVIEDVGVHQMMSLLPGSGATSRGRRSTPTLFALIIEARVPIVPLDSRYKLLKAIPRLCACFQPRLGEILAFWLFSNILFVLGGF